MNRMLFIVPTRLRNGCRGARHPHAGRETKRRFLAHGKSWHREPAAGTQNRRVGHWHVETAMLTYLRERSDLRFAEGKRLTAGRRQSRTAGSRNGQTVLVVCRHTDLSNTLFCSWVSQEVSGWGDAFASWRSVACASIQCFVKRLSACGNFFGEWTRS